METVMEDTARVEALLSDFNYRTAQISRRNRVRNLKTRTELLQYAADQLTKYRQSDWMFSLHCLETKRLREFLVFEDWADTKLSETEDLHITPGEMPAEHLYKWLSATPRTYNDLELLWIAALNQQNTFGHDRMRPEKILKSVGIVPGAVVWPAQFEATFWDPNYSIDSVYLDAVVASDQVREIAKKVTRMNNALWVDVVAGCLQLFLPFQP